MSEIKSSVNTNRVVLGGVLPVDAPFTVNLDLSEVCNLKCNYCFRSWGLKEYGYALKNNLMSWDTLKKAVEQIKQFPVPIKKISLSGHGEPLCNKELPEMAAYIKSELAVPLEIHTNATMLDSDYALRLAHADIDRVILSLQGVTSEKYEKTCGKKLDIEKFQTVLAVLFNHTRTGKIFIKTVDVALEAGEEEIFYNTFSHLCHNIYIEKAVDLWTDVHGEKEHSLKQNKLGDTLEYQHCCSSSFYTLFVDPDGDVYPCIQPLMDLKLGNVTESTLVEMWNSTQRKDFLAKQLKEGRVSIESCKNCNIAQNTIFDKKDSINEYRESIYTRLLAK